jgi:hypothetical protein
MNKIELELIDTYKEMSNHTFPECKNNCKIPLSCCSPEYCEIAIDHAKKHWGIDLESTSLFKERKTDLPLMGENGCSIEPHLRPSCTLHTCQVNSIGVKFGDEKWTSKYYELREMINDLEYKKYAQRQIDEFLEKTEKFKNIIYNNGRLTIIDHNNIITIDPCVVDIDEALANLK